jgi:hypothetical protein
MSWLKRERDGWMDKELKELEVDGGGIGKEEREGERVLKIEREWGLASGF